MSNRYTVNDTPDIVDRIERDLGRVLSHVLDFDPSVTSLVLTGGFARGEGAVLDGKPQNDYDFVVFRGLGRPRKSYAAMRKTLEERIGLHIDLAPVSTWRMRFLARSIFWYETALRGRVLWGEDVLGRIRTRTPEQLDPSEGLRLLVNRAAGLLLSSETSDNHLRRIQASKGLLAAADAHLLARGVFPPTQTERHSALTAMLESDAPPVQLDRTWMDWAYRFKTDPANAPAVDAADAWRQAARAILTAVPIALHTAGLESLDAYAQRDSVIDHLFYYRNAVRIPGARLVLNPTGRVRVGTLRLLEASLDGRISLDEAKRCLAPIARRFDEPIRTLDALRAATLQGIA